MRNMIMPQLVGHKQQQRQQHKLNIIMNRNCRPGSISKTHVGLHPRYSSAPKVAQNQLIIAALLFSATFLIAPLINCQTYDSDCKHHQHSHAARQQRQFNSQRLSSNTNPTGGIQQLVHHDHALRSTEMEHEEFSLALSGGATTIGGPTNGQQQLHSNYTLLPLQGSEGSASAAGSVSSRQDARQQPADGVKNTTPSLPNDSIGSPVMLQPPATTSSSIVSPAGNSALANRNGQPTTVDPPASSNMTSSDEFHSPSRHQHQSQPQPTQQQPMAANSSLMETRTGGDGIFAASSEMAFQARQEDGFTTASSQLTARHLHGSNSPQPVSSSPSSISIITPLIGPPTSHQQQTHTASVSASIGSQDSSSSMMKPIFVVGNPISERDYNNPSTIYDSSQQQHTQQQQPQQISGDNGAQVSFKTSKSVESTPSMATQQSQSEQMSPSTNAQQQTKTGAPATKGSGNTQQHQPPTGRLDKSAESSETASSTEPALPPPNTTGVGHLNQMGADRMGGPPLVYTDGHLATVGQPAQEMHQQQQQAIAVSAGNGTTPLQQPTARLFQGSSSNAGAAVVGNNPRRPSLPPPVNQANAASGFRSPLSPSGPLIGGATTAQASQTPSQAGSGGLQPALNSLALGQQQAPNLPNFYQTSPPYAGASMNQMGFGNGQAVSQSQPMVPTMMAANNYNKQAFVLSQPTGLTGNQQPVTSGGQGAQNNVAAQSQMLTQIPSSAPGVSAYSGRRPLNITRVEHISAECSNDLIRAVIVFNGTFKGIIYSSGYVSDPTCLYVNGTGSTRYEFSIRLNQCGTLGRQELHQPTIPGEARRRDQVMWNTLSIQYNSIIEQEWDEHFRVSCEYGSDFWKTVSFSPFNVETNTGSPVVFTINPPQCQMDVLLGHGMGPKIAVDGPVTVGDPLTLLIHMKSEKAGYDILVKNCVAHNGGKQRMQLIDSNGCVVNERFISPFRGTYNDNDLRHVTLYAYLKAFRFTGSPVLYLECEIHMCQSACPPQMCYWRRLSKRSVDDFEYEYTTNNSLAKYGDEQPVISDSLSLFKALQVRQEPEPARAKYQVREVYAEDDEAALICYRHMEVCIFLTTIASLLALIVTIAITCCCRMRKLTRSQFEHNRLAAAGSLSPSLLSIGEAISSTSGSMASLAGVTTKANQASPSWHHHQLQSCNSSKQQQRPTMCLQRQLAPTPISSFQARGFACSPQIGR